jgi:hypothetical protein
MTQPFRTNGVFALMLGIPRLLKHSGVIFWTSYENRQNKTLQKDTNCLLNINGNLELSKNVKSSSHE